VSFVAQNALTGIFIMKPNKSKYHSRNKCVLTWCDANWNL